MSNVGSRSVASRTLRSVSALALLASGSAAIASGTQAGTVVNNTARATYSLPNGGSGSVDSNTVSITVDELLNVSVVSADGGDVDVTAGSTSRVLSFAVTNNGNGGEAFRLTATNSMAGDDFDPTATAIYLDSNDNGQYDPGVDVAYISGSNDPILAADASTTVFILSSIAANQTDAQRAGLDLKAVAVTGSGAPGASFAGAGTGGGAAVVGATGADGEATGFYRVSAATVAFVKSATVVDPFGGTSAIPGSVITYTLVATVSGSGSLANLVITDPIPAGTTYRAGTLTLEGNGLTDAADGDAGDAASTAITTRLGTVAAGQVRTVTFKVNVAN